MKTIAQVKEALLHGAVSEQLQYIYCCDAEAAVKHAERYAQIIDELEAVYGPHTEVSLFSAPGRTEIGGNHTDHQHGCVLAGSVNIDMIAAVAPNELGKLRIKSEGYDAIEVEIADLVKRMEEENTSASIIRGTCRAYADLGAVVTGLDVYVASNVPKGSGISSSAAYEVLLGTILNELFMGERKVTPIKIAQIGQWVENVYFGKPCGLMDQMASSVGGVIGIDFKDPGEPVVSQVDFDPKAANLALCILDSGADHADLTDEYTAIPVECKAVAKLCGAEVLRDVPEELFYAKLPELRNQVPDRALLRAMHFYADNARAQEEMQALVNKDYELFLDIVEKSGNSSWDYLQNVTPAGYIDQQAVAITIALAKKLLNGKGAVRVHGGGFAGTVQAFVPLDMVEDFHTQIEKLLGAGCCHVMAIRPVGGVRIQ